MYLKMKIQLHINLMTNIAGKDECERWVGLQMLKRGAADTNIKLN